MDSAERSPSTRAARPESRLRLLSVLGAFALAGLACSSGGSGTTSDTVKVPDRVPAGDQDTCELPAGQYQSGLDMVTSFEDLQARYSQVVIKPRARPSDPTRSR